MSRKYGLERARQITSEAPEPLMKPDVPELQRTCPMTEGQEVEFFPWSEKPEGESVVVKFRMPPVSEEARFGLITLLEQTAEQLKEEVARDLKQQALEQLLRDRG